MPQRGDGLCICAVATDTGECFNARLRAGRFFGDRFPVVMVQRRYVGVLQGTAVYRDGGFGGSAA